MTRKLNKESILRLIEDGVFVGGVHLFDTVDSTNDWSLTEIKRGRALPFVCIADHQSKGRGRRGRHWLSPPGANIYMSLAWHYELAPDQLSLLSLAQGVAVIKALKRIGINDAWLKWPNDVLIAGNKIAGVLIETSGLGANSCNTVIGIGLNYRMPENIAADSDIHWTDVVHTGKDVLADRNALLAVLLNEVVNMCRQYQQKAAAIFTEISDELDALTGRDVGVHMEKGDHLSGKVLGINRRGELRVLVDGCEQIFSSADVSLTGLTTEPEAGDDHADD